MKPKQDPQEQLVKMATRFLYDLQKLRIASSNRNTKGIDEVHLDEDDREFLDNVGSGLKALEKQAETHVTKRLKGVPIYERWLKHQKGVGPRLAGFLVSETNIERCETSSQLWAWMGLGVTDGKADRRVKGQKARFDPERKAKVIKVLGDALIKASPFFKKPRDPETGKATEDESLWIPLEPTVWRKCYDGYKHRKETQILPVCSACEGKGTRMVDEDAGKNGKSTTKPGEKKKKKEVVCANCGGTGGPAPWGNSPAHRHQAAIRYMVKQFLKSMHVAWRQLEGLPLREPYPVEKQGKEKHADLAPLQAL
jgi:hypothetical protein